MKSDQVLANHVLYCIENVVRYMTGLTKEGFLSNFMVQDAVARNIEIVGEACSKVSKETKSKFPEIPWRDIVAMRNLPYSRVFPFRPETIRNVVQFDIPNLKTNILKIRNSF